MTFYGVFDGGEHLILFLTGEQFNELFHHNRISTSVSCHRTVCHMQIDFSMVSEERSCRISLESSIFPSIHPGFPSP